MIDVYGIGNPLIDILADVDDADLNVLGLSKGTMHLIDLDERARILAHIEGKPLTYRCGGSAPNTMIALSSLGISTAIAGKVGSDKEGDEYISQLSMFNTISNVARGENATGSSIILVTADIERTMNTFLGANREFSKADIDFDLLSTAKYFYFTGYMWDTESQKEAILAAIEFCNAHDIKIVFDAADPFVVNRNRDEFLELIRHHIYAVFANREEARLLFQKDDLTYCANELASIVRIGVIKDGKNGSIVKSGNTTYSIPVFPVKAVDSTGAGDMYAAGFLYGLIKDYSIEEAGKSASWLASRIVMQYGAQFDGDGIENLMHVIENQVLE